MASFSALIACPLMMIAQVSSSRLMAQSTSVSDPTGLGLLQRGALARWRATLPNVTFPEPIGLGVVPTATEFTDSGCKNPTGHTYYLPLDDDSCEEFFWTFSCTCDSQGYEALRAHEYLNGNCSSQNYNEYIVPVGTCVKLPMMHNYVSISDFSQCDPCTGQSLISPPARKAHQDIAEPDEEAEEEEDDNDKSSESDEEDEDAALSGLVEAGVAQTARKAPPRKKHGAAHSLVKSASLARATESGVPQKAYNGPKPKPGPQLRPSHGLEAEEEDNNDESSESDVSTDESASEEANAAEEDKDAALSALVEAGVPQTAFYPPRPRGKPGPGEILVELYEDDKCKDWFWDYAEKPGKCAAKLGYNGKPSVTYNCGCNGEKKEILYIKWFYDWCDVSQGVHYTYKFPAGECVLSPTGMTWVKINARACPSCCTDASTCKVHGDPHITVFDGDDESMVTLLTSPRTTITEGTGRDDVFDWGDYWLVKSEQVFIQARYRKVYYPKAAQPLNNTYLTSVAIGGPFLHDHTLIIEPRDGEVTWSRRGEPNSAVKVFDQDTPMEFSRSDIIKAFYYNRTAVVPEGKDVVPGMDVELPSGVKIFVDRFAKHLDFKVQMPAEAGGPRGVDGQCGNYNGDASDDTADLIGKRIGYQVPSNELLFTKLSDAE